MEANERFEMDIADTIIERPKGFSVGRRHFFLYPLTLGKAYLVKRVIDSLEIDKEFLSKYPYGEGLRLADKKREQCALLIAYHSLQKKSEVLNSRTVNIRKNLLKKDLSQEDMATLVIMCLTADQTDVIMRHLKIDKEMERMQRVTQVKDNKNTYQFGGVSIYGSIIDAACERYGWTYDYVLWEISYINLQLMLRDSIKSIYLTDKEAKRCHVPNKGYVDGNNAEAVKAAIRGGSWR